MASILIASTLSVNAGAEDRPKIEIVPNIPHRGPINAVALSPVGNRVLSGGGEPQNGFLLAEDSAIKLWDAASGQLLRTFVGHTDAVSSLAFSPDGARFLSGSDDMTIKLWDAASGQLLRTFKGHTSGVRSVAFSPDGTRVISGSGKYYSSSGEPDTDNTLKLWDAASGQLLRTFKGHTAGVRSVALSPDDTRVISGSNDGTVKLWHAATGQLLRSFEGHRGAIESVAFAPDGTRFLSESHRTLKLWDAMTGEPFGHVCRASDADIFRDVAGAEVSGAVRACGRTSRKLGRPERHTAARGPAVVRDAARARLATSDDPALPQPSPLMRLVARQK